jgi:hypothetical protein
MKFHACFVVAVGLLLVSGCEKRSTTPVANESQEVEKSEGGQHSHGDGPNGGAVADWGGGKYHVEFTVNHDTQEATVFVLDSNAKEPAPIPAEKLLLSINEPSFQVDLSASPLDGEEGGNSSRFVGKHEKLGVVQEFAGTISGEVDGTPYAGDFEEVAHDH